MVLEAGQQYFPIYSMKGADSPSEGHASVIVSITLPPSDIIGMTDRAR